MKIYHCKTCDKKFPEVAWRVGRYLETDHGPEEVLPSLVKNDKQHQEWAEDRLKISNIVVKPVCPFCHSLTLEIIDVEQKP